MINTHIQQFDDQIADAINRALGAGIPPAVVGLVLDKYSAQASIFALQARLNESRPLEAAES